jgi:hypothetical protein
MSDKLFLSYARPDSDFALRLARDLRASGVNVWVDQLDIRPGDAWDRAVEDALKVCSGVLVVLSPTSINSRSVMDEVSYALEENKRVIPILYRATPIPFRLRRLQHADFTSDYQRALSVLVPALGGTAPAIEVPHDLRIPEAPSPAPDKTHPVQDAAPEPPPAASPHLPWGSRHPRLVSAITFGVAGTLISGVVSSLAFSYTPELRFSGADPWATFTYAWFPGVLWAVAGALTKRGPPTWALGGAAVFGALDLFFDSTSSFPILFPCFMAVGGMVGAAMGTGVSSEPGHGPAE